MSIFEDDCTESQPKQKPSDNAHLTESDSRRDSLFGFTPEETSENRLEPSISDFEPLDDNRNRNLSNALTGIRDEGPAQTPEPKPAPAVEEPRNPFMNVMPEPRQAPPQQPVNQAEPALQPAPQLKPKPEFPPQRSRPTTPPPPMEAQPRRIGISTLLNWTLLALVVMLSIWNMIYLSESDLKLEGLSNTVDNLSQKVGLVNSDEVTAAKAPDLEPKLNALESRIDTLSALVGSLPEQGSANPSAADQSEQLSKLSARLDAVENNIQIADITKPAKPVTTPTPKTTTKPAVSANNWFINIAVLSDKKNASNLRDKARNLGTDTKMESYNSQGRQLYRIRAYGYRSQSSAEKDALRLQTALKLSGLWVTRQK